MRARLALAVAGQRCELREVKLSAKPDAMLAASPKGTDPVLVLSDGAVIDENQDIMRWALGQNDPEGWLGRDDPALIARNDGPFKHDLGRYKYPDRHDSDPVAHRAAGMDFLGELDGRLTDHPQSCGESRGLSDAAIMPFVRQFAGVDRDWFADQRLANVTSWLERHLDSPLFATVMLRTKPWASGDDPVVFAP